MGEFSLVTRKFPDKHLGRLLVNSDLGPTLSPSPSRPIS